MKLYVPVPGDRLVLKNDWTFTVHNDHNNWWFIDALGLPHVRTQQCTLPAATKLAVRYWDTKGTRTHWDYIVLCLLRKKIEFCVGITDIGLIDCDVHKPKRKPVRQPENRFDFDYALNEYLLDEESETDWEKVWKKEDRSEQRSEQEDGWDYSFQPTLTY